MVRLDRLATALPATGLQTENIALIRLDSSSAVTLFQPPAGQIEPVVDIRAALTEILEWGGNDAQDAAALVRSGEAEILSRKPPEQRPWCLSRGGEEMLCASASAAAEWLMKRGAAVADAGRFLARCAAIASELPVFVYGEFGMTPRSLQELPQRTLSSGWSEFFCCIEERMVGHSSSEDKGSARAKAKAWMEGNRPRIEALSRQVGIDLFHYADPDDELDDDLAHRFLALDYVCHMAPQSQFVGFLREVTGSSSVEELREAFYDPAAYFSEVRLHACEEYVESLGWPRFDYGEAGTRRLAIVTGDEDTLPMAEALVKTRVGGDVTLVPYHARHGDRLRGAAEAVGASWTLSGDFALVAEERHIDLLASIDELWAVGRPHKYAQDLKADELRQLHLLARAHDLGVAVTWWQSSGHREASLESYFKQPHVRDELERTKDRTQRQCAEPKLLRVWPEWGSSGIWQIDRPGQQSAGREVSYHMLDVPFDLIRRFALWQRCFDEGSPEIPRPKGFWDEFEAEQQALAAELAEALDGRCSVECELGSYR